jgi:hypothetical protein
MADERDDSGDGEERDNSGRFAPGNELGKRSRFRPGNPGRRPGTLRRVTKEIRAWADGEFRKHASAVLSDVFSTPPRNLREKELQLDTLRWLCDRAYGRAPQFIGAIVKKGAITPGSPEWEILKLCGQRVPGEEDFEEDGGTPF